MKLIDGVELIKNLERKIFSAEVYNDEFDGTFIGNLLCLGDVTEEVIELQQAIGWIPCSERLPKEDELVLINWDSDDLAFSLDIEIARYRKGNFILQFTILEIEQVIAWQQLPKPYEE